MFEYKCLTRTTVQSLTARLPPSMQESCFVNGWEFLGFQISRAGQDLLRFCTQQFCILELVLHALRLNSGNSGVTLLSSFGFEMCRQICNLLSLRCNERRVVGRATVFRLLLDPLVHDFSSWLNSSSSRPEYFQQFVVCVWPHSPEITESSSCRSVSFRGGLPSFAQAQLTEHLRHRRVTAFPHQ